MSQVSLSPFPRKEYLARLESVRRRMRQVNVDLLIVTSPENAFYLTGYQTQGMVASLFLCISTDTDVIFLTRQLDMGNLLAVLDEAPVTHYAAYDDVGSPIELLLKTLNERKIKPTCIGVEKKNIYLSVFDYECILAAFADEHIVDCSTIIDELRLIKSPTEIKYQREAAAIVVKAMRAAVASVALGVKDAHVAGVAITALLEAGGEWIANWPYIRVGAQGARGHAMWQNVPIGPEQPLNIELAGVVARYHVPLYRTVICRPTDEQRRIAEALMVANEAGVRTMQPGVTAGEVYGAIERVVTDYGFADLLHFALPGEPVGADGTSRSGYSVGIAFAPNWVQTLGLDIAKGSKKMLRPGMVFHTPTWLVRPNAFAMGQSSTVLINENGSENLTDEMERGPILLD